MKTENSRLGRCSSCRYWKSATDLLAERTTAGTPPDEVDSARRAIRQELTQDILSVDQADYRGWCQAAETGQSEPGTLLAINMLSQDPARMITAHDFGCLNYHPRPRRAMNAPPPDFSDNPRLGRCGGCRFWSGAENEAHTLLSLARYSDPNARMEDAEREAWARLSPPPLELATAGRRGWCKIASDYTQTNAKNLAVDPSTGAVGAVITSNDYACTRHIESRDPRMRTSPDWRWLIDRTRLYNLGPSAPINELLWSYLDPATLLDPSHPLSPLHDEHPLNIRNPRSLYFNPNPAFAAYITSPSMVRTVVETKGLQNDATAERSEGPSATTRLKLTLPFNASPSGTGNEAMTRQLMAQARLAQDFAARTLRSGGTADLTPGPTVSLAKKTDRDDFDRRQRPKSSKYVKTPTLGGFVDRRKT